MIEMNDGKITLTCGAHDHNDFSMGSYKQHKHTGYANVGIAMSAAYCWLPMVKEEFTRYMQRFDDTWVMPESWCGEGVCILMHDGSTTTLGTMLRFLLPESCTMRYDKRGEFEKHNSVAKQVDEWKEFPLGAPAFTVMCDDGISSGNAVMRMAHHAGRPTDLLCLIAGGTMQGGYRDGEYEDETDGPYRHPAVVIVNIGGGSKARVTENNFHDHHLVRENTPPERVTQCPPISEPSIMYEDMTDIMPVQPPCPNEEAQKVRDEARARCSERRAKAREASAARRSDRAWLEQVGIPQLMRPAPMGDPVDLNAKTGYMPGDLSPRLKAMGYTEENIQP